MSDYCVYIYYDGVAPFYVGQGCNRRAYDHLQFSLYTDGSPAHNKIKVMLESGIQPEIDVIPIESKAEALAEEVRLIRLFGRRCDGSGCLLNLTLGGDGGMTGFRYSEESRKKMSQAHIGMKFSEQTLCKRTESYLANLTPERRKAISERMMGNQYALGSIGPRACPVLRLYRGKLIKRYPSVSAVRIDGFSPTRVFSVLTGESSHHRGYQWQLE